MYYRLCHYILSPDFRLYYVEYYISNTDEPVEYMGLIWNLLGELFSGAHFLHTYVLYIVTAAVYMHFLTANHMFPTVPTIQSAGTFEFLLPWYT